jgi:peptidoglycan hydrolase-like protein with peptidoglycan-binding domain
MRMAIPGVIAASLLTAACGSTETERAATGGLTGAGVGALAGGPVGAAIGVVAGAVGGTLLPEGADVIAEQGLRKEHAIARTALNTIGLTPPASERTASSGSSQRTTSSGSSQPPVEALPVTPATVKQIQSQLQAQGLYNGPIDGIIGPKTRSALAQYQRKEGLNQTAALDADTLRRLLNADQASTGGSGSSTGPMMSQGQIRDRLQQNGYSSVSDVRRGGNDDYTAYAERNGQPYALDIDGRTGTIRSQQAVSAGASGQSGGSNAPTGNPSNNAGNR